MAGSRYPDDIGIDGNAGNCVTSHLERRKMAIYQPEKTRPLTVRYIYSPSLTTPYKIPHVVLSGRACL